MEPKTVRLAAMRRTEEDLVAMRTTLDRYKKKVSEGENAFQEDLLFYLAIAKASKNATMNTLMLMITPEIITNFEKHHVCDSDMAQASIAEHERIYGAIKNQDTLQAKKMMKQHFKALYQYCYHSE